MNIKLLSPLAKIPEKAHGSDAGYDLFSIESYHLQPGERKLFKTGISISIPEGCYGRIAPRSGYAYKFGIEVLAGVIDSGFLGEIGVILLNTSNGEQARYFDVEAGMKIAQIIFERCYDFPFTVVNNLEETERNIGGFGSSN